MRNLKRKYDRWIDDRAHEHDGELKATSFIFDSSLGLLYSTILKYNNSDNIMALNSYIPISEYQNNIAKYVALGTFDIKVRVYRKKDSNNISRRWAQIVIV